MPDLKLRLKPNIAYTYQSGVTLIKPVLRDCINRALSKNTKLSLHLIGIVCTILGYSAKISLDLDQFHCKY